VERRSAPLRLLCRINFFTYSRKAAAMKKTCLVIALLLSILCTTAYARRIMWRIDEEPPVSLHEAVLLAETELASEKTPYFCIGASLAKTFSEGDWELRFSSKKGEEIYVSVGSDRKVRKSKGMFEY
jgi:hypothetical protein